MRPRPAYGPTTGIGRGSVVRAHFHMYKLSYFCSLLLTEKNSFQVFPSSFFSFPFSFFFRCWCCLEALVPCATAPAPTASVLSRRDRGTLSADEWGPALWAGEHSRLSGTASTAAVMPAIWPVGTARLLVATLTGRARRGVDCVAVVSRLRMVLGEAITADLGRPVSIATDTR